MNRGEIWTVSGGVYAVGPRPSIVLQDDRFLSTDSLVVVPLTTLDRAIPIVRIAIAADDLTGIKSASFAMVDKITTVRRSQLGHRLGRIQPAALVEIERGLMVFLGLAA